MGMKPEGVCYDCNKPILDVAFAIMENVRRLGIVRKRHRECYLEEKRKRAERIREALRRVS